MSICEECGIDHDNLDVAQEFLHTVKFSCPEAAMMGAKLLVDCMRWMEAERLTIAQVATERLN